MRFLNYEISRHGITRIQEDVWKFNPKQKVSTITKHKTIIEKLQCPKCDANGLKVLMLEEGEKGWDARVTCPQCKSRGILSDTGFHFEFTQGEKKQ